MRWLIFGDVHGNLPALELLLQKEKGEYDKIICHGDVVNYGPWSNECVLLLNTLPDIICLKGNHEFEFINGSYSGSHPIAKEFFEICFPVFKELKLIKDYGYSHNIGNYIVQHTIGDKYIYSDTHLEIKEVPSSVIIGHSHQQYKRIVGAFEIVNTGSLGQNRSYINVAEYVIYDSINNNIILKHLIYDVDIVINEMEVRGYSNLCLNYYRGKRRA